MSSPKQPLSGFTSDDVANAKGPEDADTVIAAPPARVFVGLKIAPEIAIQLAQLAAALEQLSVRPVAPADIHLTLVPPWNEASIPDAIEKLGRVAGRFGAFQLIIPACGLRAAAETAPAALGGLWRYR